MDALFYCFGRALIALANALPLAWVARIGRAVGTMVYWLDVKHRHVAIRNLTMCFGNEKSLRKIRDLARGNFRRIGENFACAVKIASMPITELRSHVEVVHLNRIQPSRRTLLAIGHFGNFELYGRLGEFVPGCQGVTTYRALRHPALNRLVQTLRERSGCLFFERRTEGAQLRAAMQIPNILLGILADQRAGTKGMRGPFLGHDCSTATATAVFALRYDCDLLTGICYRVALAKWRIEIGRNIATRHNGKRRPVADITCDVNRALEKAVLRDPINWFWVHNRWKSRKSKRKHPASVPEYA